jgi:4-amino-4-deoxy-L-arabinose transferase-like glycosyltransferase
VSQAQELAGRPRMIETRQAQSVSARLMPAERPTRTVLMPAPLKIILGFVSFVAVWTLYGSISGAGLSLCGDVVEAYVWGQHFQLGYHQHPPFWAWIAGLWFLVFPNRNWAFDLLAVLNSAIGLIGCWWLIGRFAGGWERRTAFTLLLLTPFYTFLCYKYNANTIFLSIWPWALYCFLASMESPRSRQTLLFGLTMAIALMSKYYAVTLALTCFAASLVHPRRNEWYRSASPWIAALVCGLLCLPHAMWLLHDEAPPVGYFWGLTGIGMLRTISFAAQFVVSLALFHIVVIALILGDALRAGRLRWTPLLSDGDRVLAVLVLTPVLLTVLFGLVFELKVSSNMTVGAFPLAPLLLMRAVPGADPRRVFRWASTLVVSVSAAALLASPVIAQVLFHKADDPDATEPRQKVAQFVTKLWHQETGTRLRIVSGSDPYENAIGFYSADRPTVFIDFSNRHAQWIDKAMLGHYGFLIVCVHEDAGCVSRAKPYLPPSTRVFHVTLSQAFQGETNPSVLFDIYLVPPPSVDVPVSSSSVPHRLGRD